MPNSGQSLEDALHPKMAGSTEGMTLQVLAQIRDSLTAMSRDIRSNNEATADVRERVIRLEERDKRLDQIEGDVKTLGGKVAVLVADKDRREGITGAFRMIKDWLPFLGSVAAILAAAWLYGRSAGIVPAPPTPVARLEANGSSENHRIEGTVGGKP